MTVVQPWQVPGQWYYDLDGYGQGAVAYVGPVVWPYGMDAGTTQTAVMVFGPAGATGNFPIMAPGQPGMPPELRNVTVMPVPYGEALPTPPGAFTCVSPGGPGIAAVYDLTLYVNSGQQGEPGKPTNLSSAPDITGTVQNGWTLAWNEAENCFNYVAQLVNQVFNPSAYNSVSSSGQQSEVLTTVGVGAQSNSWYPWVSGSCVLQGTANTLFTVTANLNSATGPQLGVGYGVGGAQCSISVGAAIQNLSEALVPAGQTAEIYFVATQTANTLDAWSNVSANTAFQVAALQMPSL